jgi:cell division protein FtsB
LKLLSHIPGWLKNKYLLTGVVFLVWLLFFDKNDIITQYDRVMRSRELTKNELTQSKLIDQTRKELYFLTTNAQTIEKYARENYLMKKDNEDLFIIGTP